MGTVEVETSESVNHLEARSQWAHLGRARAPFHLYVPLGSVDIARRLAAENQVHVSELWSFHTIGDQTHFRLVHRTPDDTRRSSEPRGIVTSNLSRTAQARAGRAGPAVKIAAVPPPAPVKKAVVPMAKSAKKVATAPARKAAASSRSAAPTRKPAPARAQKRK